MVLGKIALARGALALAPGAAIGMAIGPQVAPPEPAAIATAPMEAEVLRGIHGARSVVRRWHRLRGCWRRRVGMGGLVLTQDALRPLGQAGKRLRFLGARVSGRLRGGDRLATGSGITGPQRVEHEENA